MKFVCALFFSLAFANQNYQATVKQLESIVSDAKDSNLYFTTDVPDSLVQLIRDAISYMGGNVSPKHYNLDLFTLLVNVLNRYPNFLDYKSLRPLSVPSFITFMKDTVIQAFNDKTNTNDFLKGIFESDNPGFSLFLAYHYADEYNRFKFFQNVIGFVEKDFIHRFDILFEFIQHLKFNQNLPPTTAPLLNKLLSDNYKRIKGTVKQGETLKEKNEKSKKVEKKEKSKKVEKKEKSKKEKSKKEKFKEFIKSQESKMVGKETKGKAKRREILYSIYDGFPVDSLVEFIPVMERSLHGKVYEKDLSYYSKAMRFAGDNNRVFYINAIERYLEASRNLKSKVDDQEIKDRINFWETVLKEQQLIHRNSMNGNE